MTASNRCCASFSARRTSIRSASRRRASARGCSNRTGGAAHERPWLVEAASVDAGFRIRHVRVINDLEALAYGVTVLEPSELKALQVGDALPDGNAAVIAAGTGLGEAMLHNVDGRFVPAASEEDMPTSRRGHRGARDGPGDDANLRPRQRRARRLRSRPGEYLPVHARFVRARSDAHTREHRARALCEGVGAVKDFADLPARITKAAMEGRCDACGEAFDLFIAAYGAEAGNLALRCVATAGVYIGGGIAPKILPALESGMFMDAFRAKEPMADLVATMPVSVILNPDAALLGAAVHAQYIALTD